MGTRHPMTTIALLLAALLLLLLGGLLLVDRLRPVPPAPRRSPAPRTEARAPPPVTGIPIVEVTAPIPPSPPSEAAAPVNPAPVESRYGRIRFRDAVSGEILKSLEQARVSHVVGFRGMSSLELDDLSVQKVPGEEGWIKTFAPGSIDDLDTNRSFWEFSLPGYEIFRMVPGEDRDGQTIDLAPWQTRVRGRILATGEEARPLRALLFSEAENELTGSLRPRGLPQTTGPFEIKDLPDGKWVIWAWTTDGGPRLHAVRRFERLGNLVDLGDLPLEPGSSFRARVVDGEGRPVEKPRLVGTPGLQSTAFRDMMSYLVPGAVPVPSKEEGGWLLFEDLPAGMPWMVRSLSIPGVEGRVRTPAAAGALATLEIPWTGRRVRCRIRFTVDGSESVQWGPELVLDSGPVDGWDRAGTLEAVLPSGDYRVTHYMKVDSPESPMRPFTGRGGWYFEVRGRLTVPPEEIYEAVIDLSAPKLPEKPR